MSKPQKTNKKTVYVATDDPDIFPNNGFQYDTLEMALREAPTDLDLSHGGDLWIAKVEYEPPVHYTAELKAVKATDAG